MSAEGARFMWCLVMFDLPVVECHERRAAYRFRRFLVKDGYLMIQYSVYLRPCRGMDSIKKHLDRLEKNLPPEGQVRSMVITDAQYERMRLHIGKKTAAEQYAKPTQLVLF